MPIAGTEQGGVERVAAHALADSIRALLEEKPRHPQRAELQQVRLRCYRLANFASYPAAMQAEGATTIKDYVANYPDDAEPLVKTYVQEHGSALDAIIAAGDTPEGKEGAHAKKKQNTIPNGSYHYHG